MMIKTLSLFLLLAQSASAMNVNIESWSCREEPITVDFDRICTQDNTCTTGKQSNLEGTMTYYGLYDQYGLTDESEVYMNLNMSLFAAGYDSSTHKPVYNSTLYDMVPFSICHETIFNTDDGYSNNNKGCPASGNYQFQSSITIPPPSNGFNSWMFTGYTGIAELAIYMGEGQDSKVLGYCTMKISTETDDSGLAYAPSGKTATITVITCFLMFLLLGLGALYVDHKRRGKDALVKKLTDPDIPLKDKITGNFTSVEEETLNEAKRSWHIDLEKKQDDVKSDDVTEPAATLSKMPALKQGLLTNV